MGSLDVVVLLLPMLLASHANPLSEGRAGQAQGLQLRVQNAMAAQALSEAGRSAAERLQEPGCARVFGEFRDASGRTLQERLDSIGRTGTDQLASLYFYDGTNLRQCQSPTTLAVTAPGSVAVYVCPQFVRRQRQDPSEAPVTIIHELLHTLGLGENPPSSEEISRHVRSRCGR